MLKRALSHMTEVFSTNVLAQGQVYCKQGHVLTLRLSDGLLKARVMGHSNQIYDVYLDFKVWPKRLAQCSCSMGRNCKHVVACLLALQARERLDVIPAFQDKFFTKPEDLLQTKVPVVSEKLIIEDQVTWYSESHAQG